MLNKNYCILFILLIINQSGAFSQKKDSTHIKIMEAYYDKSFNNPADPLSLLYADTLLQMARKYNDTLYTKRALRANLDHYYYGGGSTDSIIAWVNRIKAFAKHDGDKQTYFFVWSARLINHYIKRGEYNIALVEAEKMLEEAEKEQDKEGVAQCYSALANIYLSKGSVKKAQEFMFKEIELFELHDSERYNISLQYSDAAKIYIETEQPEKAPALIEKAMQHAKTPYHLAIAKLTHALHHLAENDVDEAEEALEECRLLFARNPSIRRHYHYMQEVEVSYYRHIGNHQEALKVLEAHIDELKKNGDLVFIVALTKTKADILSDMNRKEEAAELYRAYIEEQKKEKERNEEITAGEFATLLNLQQVNAEKRELERISQEKHIQNIRSITLSLIVLLLVFIGFYYYQRTLNIKLKRSRDNLDEKNRILIEAEEELRLAKEAAEQSSWMKTEFIQNMSHEIRTPLNSIVGFSAILADFFPNDKEVGQYAKLIEENSNLLLKLVGDILDISALDDENLMFRKLPTDVNSCCNIAIRNSRQLLHEGVKLDYLPTRESLIIDSNPDRIVQILENLLNNSAKFTYKGSILFEYQVDDENRLITFTISDTGIGIPPDKQELVFERFVKLDEFTQGTGLGLPICRIIARKLGGTLVIDKAYTQGTRFVLTIPI